MREADKPISKRPRRRRRTLAWMPLAAAASVAVALGVWMLVSREPLSLGPPVATVTQTVGTVYALAPNGTRTVLRSGDTLRAGHRLETVADTRIRFEFLDDATDVDLAEASSAALMAPSSPESLYLEYGSLSAVVAQRGADRMFSIGTPQARADVLGTRFRLFTGDVDLPTSKIRQVAAVTRLDVESGRVQFTRLDDTATIDVHAGEYALASKDFSLKVYAHDAEWIEGPVLFSDAFEDARLTKWNLSVYQDQGTQYQFIEYIQPDTTPYAAIERVEGREPGSAALSVQLPARQNTAVRLEPTVRVTEFLALREEFDVLLTPPSSAIENRMHDSPRPPRRFPIKGATPTERAFTSREWTKVRHDLIWRTDDQGEPCLDIKHYIKDELYIWEWHYPDNVHFGVLIKRGTVLVDNYSLRELIPAHALAPQ